MRAIHSFAISFFSSIFFGTLRAVLLFALAGCQSFSDGGVSAAERGVRTAAAADIFAPQEFPESGALAFTAGMGLGINIGNSLDCITDRDGPGTDETGWGNPRISREYIRALREYGFQTVRLPVTWAEHTDSENDFLIDAAWMARVTEVTDWCMEEGLFVIVNLHHDGGTSRTSWILDAANDYDAVSRRFERTWRQIAENFRGHGERLIFEAMNEVGFDSAADGYEILNSLNRLFVDTVRSTGGENASRYLMFAGYWTDIEKSCAAEFAVPPDSADGRLILSVHYYTPSSFAISTDSGNQYWYQYEWGTQYDISVLNGKFRQLYGRFVANGIPVVLGEFGLVQEKDAASRTAWYACVMRACRNLRICPVLWDTGHEISRYAPFEMKAGFAAALQFIREMDS